TTVTVQVIPAPAARSAIAFGTEPGPSAQARLLDGPTRIPLLDLTPFPGYTGGLNVAVGDVNGDGVNDLVVGTVTNDGHVKVFDGRNGALMYSFFVYPDPRNPNKDGYAGGLQVACADIDNDGFGDIIVGTRTQASHVKAFSGLLLQQNAQAGTL